MIDNDYYRRVKTSILYSKEYNNLLGKSEINKSISQYAIVELASSMADCMAEELGYNPKKADVLAMCKGIVFPPYGDAGMKYLEEIAEKEKIKINKKKVCYNTINRILRENKFAMVPDFYKSINELFEKKQRECESKIVTVIYEMLDDILILRDNSPIMKERLNNRTYDILEDAINESKRLNIISYSPKLKKLKAIAGFKRKKGDFKDEQQKVLRALWNEYKEQGLVGEKIE